MSRKVCVITGATRGLGKAMAVQIAQEGYEMLLVCRDMSKAAKVREDIIHQTGNNHVLIVHANLNSVREVCKAVDEIKSKYDRIDVLINNAAVYLSRLKVSEDGFEEQYAVNYLSAFILTLELTGLLNKSANPKVVTVGSNMHKVGSLSFPDPAKVYFYSGMKTYANTKLAIMMFTFEMARRFPDIACNVFHPGAVNTGIGYIYSHGITRYGWKLMSYFFISASKAAETGTYLACSDTAAGQTGGYFYRNKMVMPSSKSQNSKRCEQLWEETIAVWQHVKQRLDAEKARI